MNTATMERPPLTWITGTVHHIAAAPASNRSGKIKLDSGQILSAFPDKLVLVEEGGTYGFGCTVTPKGGVNYHDVKAVKPIEAAPERKPERPARSLSAAGAAAAEPQRQVPQQNGNGNGYYRPTAPRDAERMFVCSVLNAFIQTGRIADDVATLTTAVKNLRLVWADTFGADDAGAG